MAGKYHLQPLRWMSSRQGDASGVCFSVGWNWRAWRPCCQIVSTFTDKYNQKATYRLLFLCAISLGEINLGKRKEISEDLNNTYKKGHDRFEWS